MFEEEYKAVIENYQFSLGENDDYIRYLDAISAKSTHTGYFSVDKKGKLTDGKIDKKEKTSDDVSAYDLTCNASHRKSSLLAKMFTRFLICCGV